MATLWEYYGHTDITDYTERRLYRRYIVHKAASFHERMFIGSRTLCSSAHGPYVRWTMNILSFEWRVNFTRVKR